MVKVSIPALRSRTPAEMPPIPAPTIATVGVPAAPNRFTPPPVLRIVSPPGQPPDRGD